MSVRKVRFMVGLMIFILSSAILVWGIWPHERGLKSLDFTVESELPKLSAEVEPPVLSNLATLIEHSRLVAEFPALLRLDDAAFFGLRLDLGNPAGDFEDLFKSYNVLAQARFEIGSVQISPEGELSEPLRPAKAAVFSWSVRPTRAGEYRGVIWLHLNLIPLGGGKESIIPLTAQFTDFQTATFLGLSGAQARIAGGIGLVLGAYMLLDLVMSGFWQSRQNRVNLF